MILADEPTAALDSENGKAVMALLAEVAKDTRRAVLVVTHDHRTLEYGDRMIRIEDGKIASRARRRPTSARGEFDLDRGRLKFSALLFRVEQRRTAEKRKLNYPGPRPNDSRPTTRSTS